MNQKPSVLFSKDLIQSKVSELGQKITADYRGKSLIAIGVLKGSFIFLADLVRAIDLPVQIEFIGVTSYQGTSSTGEVRITHDLSIELKDQHVLLVEDIIDTGTTIDYLLDMFKLRQPASLRVAALLTKPEAHIMHHPIDYKGFVIQKEFVVGYGLDLDGAYRNLPAIMQLQGAEDPTNPQ